uniref:Uncharacterized protein n=1 Tax=Trichogramma kaykai TaxID=54128 RepID=A0ABD2W4E6_9HYME
MSNRRQRRSFRTSNGSSTWWRRQERSSSSGEVRHQLGGFSSGDVLLVVMAQGSFSKILGSLYASAFKGTRVLCTFTKLSNSGSSSRGSTDSRLQILSLFSVRDETFV